MWTKDSALNLDCPGLSGSFVSFLVLTLKGAAPRKTIHIEKCLDSRSDDVIFFKKIPLERPPVMRSMNFTRHIILPSQWKSRLLSSWLSSRDKGRPAGLTGSPPDLEPTQGWGQASREGLTPEVASGVLRKETAYPGRNERWRTSVWPHAPCFKNNSIGLGGNKTLRRTGVRRFPLII